MPKKLIVELPEYKHNTKAMYANAPIRLNGVPEEISIEHLCQKVGQTFIYSNALFSEEQHASYMKQEQKSKTTQSNFILQKFQQLGFTDMASFVICNMGSLGHGVFANKDFEVGECFILYSGIIKEKLASQNISNYAFSYDKEIKLYVDAAETGNISRFIQHMPLNFNLFSKHIQEDACPHNKASVKNVKDLADFWQWQNIDYKADLKEDEIAWSNLSIIVIPVNGVPCIIFYNTQKINKGDQLGISYGNGYWLRRNVKPELFDLKGNIIPKIKYGYKEIIIDLPLLEYFNQLPNFQQTGIVKKYNASMFRQDLQRQQELMQPVWFSHLAEPISIIKLRELLLQYNVIGKEYEQIENDFISRLRTILPKEFNVKIYERNPHPQSTKPIFDLVYITDDLMKWLQLTAIIKGPTFSQRNIQTKCLKFTQEVFIMDIGNDIENQLFLINILTIAKSQDLFTRELPEDLISGPTRKDLTGIIMATAEESIHQILFHNPGLTRQEINNAYKLVDIFSAPMDSSDAESDLPIINDREVSLNMITSSFFDKGLPTKWKIYPSDQLKGKYIGHQVRFFTIPIEHATQAEPFAYKLKQDGFDVELKKAKDKPSIVVDLTTSKQMLK